MSVQRYTIQCFPHGFAKKDENGSWVGFDDYAALAAENERLKASIRKLEKENAMIQEAGFAGAIVTKTVAAENKRLRKAGDRLAFHAQDDGTGWELHDAAKAWHAAKEGRDAK